MNIRLMLLSLLAASAFSVVSQVFAAVGSDPHITLEITPPKWQLPAGRAVLAEREASLSPSEQPLALQLHPLLQAEQYREALALLKAQQSDEPSAALWLIRGQIEQQLGDNQAAAQSYRAALKILPEFARAHRALALVAIAEESYSEARTALARAVSLGITDSTTYGYLGYINLKAGQSFAAVQAYQQALVLDPDNRDWQSGLLYALTQSGQYDSAEALLGDLINQRSDDTELWLQRAQVQLRQHHSDQALSSLEVAMRLGGVSSANRQAAAQLHMQSGSFARALELLDKNLAAGDINMGYLSRLANWMMSEEQWRAASQLLTQIEVYQSKLSSTDNARRLHLKARLAEHNGEQKSAMAAMQNAIELDPSFADAIVGLARLKTNAQAYAEAEMLYSRAAALPGYRQQALMGKAQALINQERYRESLALLRDSYREQPSGELQRNINTLERIVNQRGGRG
ncbi:tetratricopeptide repeat protein [Gilvimarinus polysaccharolyticus]|uniref:tetratricopeptide repeat protein n=1 Tax=Gilvimarinus polysaccharolyticus TaxID=863921 RepID=UPI00067358A9|nr:tetratricopeptide repeat protein [Gilvimarinus polysaccharolyticus]